MAGLDTELNIALKAMDSSFQVRLISTFAPDLVWAPGDAEAALWLDNKNYQDFDQFPVKQASATVGILIRKNYPRGKNVRETMLPLREGLIVSADMPIADLIPEMRASHYRLVVRGGQIDGLVTQSDLLKLPVRLVIFALITQLEQIMADVVSAHWLNGSWFQKLNQGRQEKIIQKEAQLQKRGMNPPKIELTEFGDKGNLCKQLINGNKTKFKKDLADLCVLRDQIAHSTKKFVDGSGGKTGVVAFVDKFESAKRWIGELTKLSPMKRNLKK